jgi:transcriptional regulator with XRE-family HTH domain
MTDVTCPDNIDNRRFCQVGTLQPEPQGPYFGARVQRATRMARRSETPLALRMRKKRVRQQALAKRLGLTPTTISHWVRGRTLVPLEHREVMAKALGLSPAELLALSAASLRQPRTPPEVSAVPEGPRSRSLAEFLKTMANDAIFLALCQQIAELDDQQQAELLIYVARLPRRRGLPGHGRKPHTG